MTVVFAATIVWRNAAESFQQKVDDTFWAVAAISSLLVVFAKYTKVLCVTCIEQTLVNILTLIRCDIVKRSNRAFTLVAEKFF